MTHSEPHREGSSAVPMEDSGSLGSPGGLGVLRVLRVFDSQFRVGWSLQKTGRLVGPQV